MMQVDLDLAPPCVTVLGQAVDEALVVLLGRIKVRVAERVSIGVAKGIDRLWIGAAPALETPLLLVRAREGRRLCGNDRGLEVVGDGDDEVHGHVAAVATAGLLPCVCGEPAEAPQRLDGLLAQSLHRHGYRPSTDAMREAGGSAEACRRTIAEATASATAAAPAGV